MVSTIKYLGFAAFLTFIGVFTATSQEAAQWDMDKAHTSVNFSINHFFSAVTGKFGEFDGTIRFDPDNLSGSKADFTVSIASINTDEEKRDKHLQSKDFFNVKKYPTMSFTTSKIVKETATSYLVHGKLTIRDVTKDVVLPMKVTGQMEHPMKKNMMILGLVIDTTIDRTEYGVGTGSWAATAVVGDEVKIHIPMELTRKK